MTSISVATTGPGYRRTAVASRLRCVREQSGGYEAGARSVPLPMTPDDRAAAGRGGLSEPAARTAALVDLAARADEAQLALVEHLIRHRQTVQSHTGLPIDVTLSQLGRLTTSDRRMLLTAAEMLAVMPQIRDAWRSRQLSWPQIRIITMEAKRLPEQVRERFDLTVAGAAGEYRDCEPDELVARVRQLVDALRPERQAQRERRADQAEFVALSPRLDGTGGTLFADLGPVSFATVAEALTAGLDKTELVRSTGRDGAMDRDAVRHNLLTLGRLRAERLVELVASWPGGNAPGAMPRPRRPARPRFVITATLDSLLGRSDDPAAFLTRLAGGRLQTSVRTARRILREFDVDVRLLVVNDGGDTIGVGRTHREPPGWLREAVTAQFPTCTAPGCDRPSRACDIDHHTDWSPAAGGGSTDLDNLGPACRPHHRQKTAGGWTVTTTPRGDRVWRHRRSGLTVRKPPTHRQLTLLDLPPPRD